MKRRRGWATLLALALLAVLLIPLGDRNAPHKLGDMQAVEPLAIIDIEPSTVTVEGRPISQIIQLAMESGSIVDMELEEYIFSVLAAEMPASFEPEALKAQAVAARTYALRKQLSGGCSAYKGADICARSSHCQAFCTEQERKKNWGNNFKSYTAKLKKAVEATAGQILTYNDAPILTMFHASSAGYTESVENVYSQTLPYLRSVASPEEQALSIDTQEELSRSSFCRTVNGKWPKAGLSPDRLENQVEIVTRYKSGRVDTIRLGGVTVTGTDLRRAVDIRSTNFTIAYDRNSIIFHTRGYGHGVGMSQNGANIMAKEGSSYWEILQHYYTGVEIQSIQ